MRRWRTGVLAWFCAATLALPALAQNAAPTETIAEARAALERAAADLRAAEERPARIAALANAIRAHESALAAYRSGLRVLATKDRTLAESLTAERDRLGRVLGALQALSMTAPSALSAYPGGPVEAARAAGLLAGLTPELQAEVAALSERLEELRRIRTGQEIARAEAMAALAALQALRGEARRTARARNAALPERAALKREAEAARTRAKDLAELAAILAARAPTTPPQRFEDQRGRLAPPVAGRLVAGFGEPDPWGRPGQGLSFEAPAFAQVRAPVAATVRYAGPLIDYANVLILEPEKGWFLILAGLSSVERAVGETVLAGEILGDLGGPLPTDDEFLQQAGGENGEGVTERLYLELRRAETAIDPAPWFDPETGK
ncbi:MAG: peptidoglycan DD-metalloendopeptidase family protein [Pseudomonadota bacterium]